MRPRACASQVPHSTIGTSATHRNALVYSSSAMSNGHPAHYMQMVCINKNRHVHALVCIGVEHQRMSDARERVLGSLARLQVLDLALIVAPITIDAVVVVAFLVSLRPCTPTRRELVSMLPRSARNTPRWSCALSSALRMRTQVANVSTPASADYLGRRIRPRRDACTAADQDVHRPSLHPTSHAFIRAAPAELQPDIRGSTHASML